MSDEERLKEACEYARQFSDNHAVRMGFLAGIAHGREQAAQVAKSKKFKLGAVLLDNPGDPGLVWNGACDSVAAAIRRGPVADAKEG